MYAKVQSIFVPPSFVCAGNGTVNRSKFSEYKASQALNECFKILFKRGLKAKSICWLSLAGLEADAV